MPKSRSELPLVVNMPRTPAEMTVTDIPMPWVHKMGVVVDVEYPEDRPLVVDLVFSSGLKTAESKGSVYAQRRNGEWDIARFVSKKDRRRPVSA